MIVSFPCRQITVAYLSATTGAMAVAIGLNSLTKVK